VPDILQELDCLNLTSPFRAARLSFIDSSKLLYGTAEVTVLYHLLRDLGEETLCKGERNLCIFFFYCLSLFNYT
jgi:hypothetical protein